MNLNESQKSQQKHTDGTDDRGAAEVLRRHHFGVELGVPFQLHPVAQMVEGGACSHFESFPCG